MNEAGEGYPSDGRPPRNDPAEDVPSSSHRRPPGIEARRLSWTYAGRSRPAISELDFELAGGRVLLVLGPSGSGKSTLARAIAGLVPHVLPGTMTGGLTVGELDVRDTPARLLGARVGLVFQDPETQIVMSRVDDEVAFGLENRGWPRPAMVARVPRALGEVGLAGFESRATATLSGGEKQRLAIADVLAPAPGLLVFDEPTANLDPPAMYATFEQLAALARRRDRTIVLVEHRLEAALPLADDVLLLDEMGRQLAFGPACDVGPEVVALLERSGAWVPRAWQPAQPPVVANAPRLGAGLAARRAPLVEARDVRVEYAGGAGGPRRALDGVSLVAHEGERIGLVGPNGAGKSTLLFALGGLRRPDGGTIRFRSTSAADRDGYRGPTLDPARLRSDEVAAHVGLVFQDPELGFVASTARGEVLASVRAVAGAKPRGVATDAAADGVLARFGLAALATANPFWLSQGEQRRLSLAALALQPPAVLLLDEPTFGLDRRGTAAVLELLDALRLAGQAQLLATHDPRLLPACDRVVALDRGRVVFDGRPEAFLAAPPYEPAEPWRDEAPAGLAAATASR